MFAAQGRSLIWARGVNHPGGMATPSVRNWRNSFDITMFGLLLGLSAGTSLAATPGSPDDTPIRLPITPACVSSPFGPRVMPGRPLAGMFHGGIDIPATVGSPVTAVASGTIIRIHRRGVGGLEILVQHPGFVGVYSHLGLIAPKFAEGQKIVRGGERIGTVGRSGLTYGSHLYFGMIAGGRAVDPAPHLHVDPCRSGTQTARDAPAPPTQGPVNDDRGEPNVQGVRTTP